MVLRLVLACLCTLALAACDAPGKLQVMRANSLVARGSHSEAILLYLRALEHPASAPYAEHGLGTAFHVMGEDAAALDRFAGVARALDALPEGRHRELRFRNHYNAGVVLFGEGDFDGAAAAFRDALRVSGGRLEAMRNLELSLMSREAEGDRGGGGGRGAAGATTEAMELTFGHLRAAEVERWRGREWPEEDRTPGDDR